MCFQTCLFSANLCVTCSGEWNAWMQWVWNELSPSYSKCIAIRVTIEVENKYGWVGDAKIKGKFKLIKETMSSFKRYATYLSYWINNATEICVDLQDKLSSKCCFESIYCLQVEWWHSPYMKVNVQIKCK